ncbi:hypothetical protein F5X68DRAFT_198612 [Plectosphaerella plurivora]|uniref:Uncharacterized protein n=1 Tax=Plectosphaerella plurivora TaxID=936078 RepID=A0A9P8VN19_9PEZI|nr:hypothetical protein F5X68DRAFT_198612 [Plectosphaerella plurivora]
MERTSLALTVTTREIQAARGAQSHSDSRRNQKDLGRRIRSVANLALRVRDEVHHVEDEEDRRDLVLLPKGLPRHSSKLVQFTESELDRINTFNNRCKDSGSFRFWIWVRKSLGRDHVAENTAMIESCKSWLTIVDLTVVLCRERRLEELRIEYGRPNSTRNLELALYDEIQEAKLRKSMRAHRRCNEKMRSHGIHTKKLISYSVYIIDDVESNQLMAPPPPRASRRISGRLSPLDERRDAAPRRHELEYDEPSPRPSSRRVSHNNTSHRRRESDIPAHSLERDDRERRRSSRTSQQITLSPERLWQDHVTTVMMQDPSAGRIERPMPAQGIEYPRFPPPRSTSDSGYGGSVPPTARLAIASPDERPPVPRSSRRTSASRERERDSAPRRRSASREGSSRAAEQRDAEERGSRYYPPPSRRAPIEEHRRPRKREVSISGDSGYSDGESRRSSHSNRRRSRAEGSVTASY